MKKVFPLLILLLLLTRYSYGNLNGFGSYEFKTGSKSLTIWFNIPEIVNSGTSIVFVMHGVKRNAKDYCENWIEFSNEKKFILVVPEFSKSDFPGSSQYNLANIVNSSGEYSKKKDWYFHIIEDVFKDIQKKFTLKTKNYYLYGHSAGAQFVQRFVIFYPEASLKLAISANAGWYTLPDRNIVFPYGLNGVNLSDEDLKKSLSKKMIILLGTKDTDPNHKYLRKTPEAQAQGKHRFERGKNFFKSAREIAFKLNTPLNWQLNHVPGVGHSNSRMSKKAVFYIK